MQSDQYVYYQYTINYMHSKLS